MTDNDFIVPIKNWVELKHNFRQRLFDSMGHVEVIQPFTQKSRRLIPVTSVDFES